VQLHLSVSWPHSSSHWISSFEAKRYTEYGENVISTDHPVDGHRGMLRRELDLHQYVPERETFKQSNAGSILSR
jgi:hypothetical protein